MSTYVESLLEAKNICEMNDTRTIITDRMGPLSHQDVELAWEGYCNGELISITYDEAKLLFENGLTRNVERKEEGEISIHWIFSDIRRFPRAIVCGIMAPTTAKEIRKEFIAYAKKMGYITEEMTPINMKTGTKSLIFNSDDTYNISFEWNENVLKKINREFLEKFTKKYFSEYDIEINGNIILMKNLSEDEAFSRDNIDLFREYDIQLLYLNPEIDKVLLLRALMQRAFINLPCNTLRRGQFTEAGNMEIPEDKKEQIDFNEYGKKTMNSGMAVYYPSEGKNFVEYSYSINVPYSEKIRELLVDAEKILKEKYAANEEITVLFLPFVERFDIIYRGKNEEICKDIQRELITLDYAVSFLKDENEFNHYQLYTSIISLLEADSSGIYRDEYFSYLETLKKVLPEKCDRM